MLPRLKDKAAELDALELRKIILLAQASEITTLSVDSLKRHHADKIKRLSPRRLGMALGDALLRLAGTCRQLGPAAFIRRSRCQDGALSKSECACAPTV
jgi:hypothetical protein